MDEFESLFKKDEQNPLKREEDSVSAFTKEYEEYDPFKADEEYQKSFDDNNSQTARLDEKNMEDILNFSVPAENVPVFEAVNNYSKPKSGKLLPIMIIMIILLAIAGAVFVFYPYIYNFMKMTSLSDAEYSAFMEKKTLDKVVDEIFSEKSADEPLTSSDMGINVELTEQSLTMLQAISVDLKSIKLDNKIDVNDGKTRAKSVLGTDKGDVIDITAFYNEESETCYFTAEKLLDGFVKASIKDINEAAGISAVDAEDISNLTNEELSTLCKSILSAYEQAGKDLDAKLEKNVTMNIGDISKDANVVTVKLDKEKTVSYIKAVFNNLKSDEEFKSICNKHDIDISVLDTEAESISSADFDEIYTIETYFDKKGVMIGKSVYSDSGENKIEIAFVEEKGNFSFVANINEGDDVLTLGFDNKADKNKNNGEIYLKTKGSQKLSFKLSYTDLEVVNQKNSFMNGSIKFSIDGNGIPVELMDIVKSISIKLEADEKRQDIAIKSSYANIDVYYQLRDTEEFTMPADDDVILDVKTSEDLDKLSEIINEEELQNIISKIFGDNFLLNPFISSGYSSYTPDYGQYDMSQFEDEQDIDEILKILEQNDYQQYDIS